MPFDSLDLNNVGLRFCGTFCFCGDSLTTSFVALRPTSSIAKLSRRFTEGGTFTRLGVTIEPRIGEDLGPKDGCLRGEDWRKVLIGDFDLGIGIRMFDFRAVKTAAGSGIVPASALH